MAKRKAKREEKTEEESMPVIAWHQVFGGFYEKGFDSGDTGLTYRQVHLLDTRDDGDGSWRRYCFSDLIGIEAIKRLKGLGIQGVAAQNVFEAFQTTRIRLVSHTQDLNQIPEAPWDDFRFPLAELLTGNQIIMTVTPKGEVLFHDVWSFEDFKAGHDVFVYADMNVITNAVFAEHGLELAPSYKSILQIASERLEDAPEKADLSEKERELIHLLRQGDYDVVRVKMQDGDIKLLYGESRSDNGDGMTPTELMRIVREKGYQKITLQKCGDKIVSVLREDRYKPDAS